MKNKRTLALVLVAGLVLPLGQFSIANAADAMENEDAAVTPYLPYDKSLVNVDLAGESNVVEVKYRQGVDVSVQGKQIRTAGKKSRSAFTANKATSVKPLFASSETEIAAEKAKAKSFSNREQSDLENWVQITAESNSHAREIVKDLNKSGNVEVAYVRPTAVKMENAESVSPPAATNLESFQGYLGSPEEKYGINAHYAHGIKGGDGTGITIADVEYGWDLNHPDLTKLRNAVVTKGTPIESYHYHGTAVMGELVADKNGFGVTGIAYGAKAILSHVNTKERRYNPANAINVAANQMKAGDVLVIEQQVKGCGGGYAPLEIWPAAHDAIRSAVNKGIHVVEAAGNGRQDLDATCYGNPFPKDKGDSGAIIVGAGPGYTKTGGLCGYKDSRQGFSTYGTRVNSFAWGRCVTTTWTNGGYTHSFSGTSSATPIVAGAVASLSGIAKARGVSITPARMRTLLTETGTKAKAGELIGTMPDLKKAIAALGFETNHRCANYAKNVKGEIGNAGMVFPQRKSYFSTSGQHKFCIDSEGAGFSLELQKWEGAKWGSVAKSGDTNMIDYSGTGGSYRVIIRSKGSLNSFKLAYDVAKAINL